MESILARADALHARVRRVRVLHPAVWAGRILLALGFLPSGLRKVVNDPFTREESLGELYVMFTALHEDFGALYITIGVCQVAAALLLLIPRTAALGALIYLPVISGIVVLTTSLDFGRGTPTITILMLAGTIGVLCWDWHRIRGVLGPAALPAAPAVATAPGEGRH